MNAEQALMIVVGLDAAARAGFTVSVEPLRDGVQVHVGHKFILAGKASDRVASFDVVGRNSREALGNALAVLTIEIGRDLREAVQRQAAEDLRTG